MDSLRRDAAEIAAALWLLEQPRIGPARAWSLIQRAGSALVASRRLATEPSLLDGLAESGSDATANPNYTAHPNATANPKLSASAKPNPNSGRVGGSVGHRTSRGIGVFEACQRHGIAIVFRGDPDYPDRLLHLPQPPLMLFAVGDVSLLSRGGVALVGSRKASVYGRAVARDLGAAAVRSGQVVISGLALGIDAAAHEGALSVIAGSGGSESAGATSRPPEPASRPTMAGGAVAVLGSGPERAAPRANAAIYRGLRRFGVVVSEYPPGTPARSWHFPRRNRLIAALAHEVIVVEAAEKSGALITARVGLDIGRDVLAVPGRIDGPGARGSNRLLADGARPVISIEDWLADRDEFDFRVEGHPNQASSPEWPEASRILAEFLAEPIDPPSLARQVDWPLSRLLPLLTELELLGVVHRLPGPRYRRAG